MCVYAGISILFNQVRYEHPHHKKEVLFRELLFYFLSCCLNLRPLGRHLLNQNTPYSIFSSYFRGKDVHTDR